MKSKIYTAALLHDIGKFYQRADKKIQGSWVELKTENFKESVFCPVYKGKHSHKHVLWTAQFIEKILGVTGGGEDSLTRIAAMHHAPGDNFLYNIITLADHLSSGMDRNKDDIKDLQDENDLGKYKQTPMYSVFERVGKTISDNKTWKYRLPLKKYTSKSIFPLEESKVTNIEEEYEKLWTEFVKEIAVLKESHGKKITKEFADTLLYLLQKYTSYIPSSTQDLPDVSLYDHSKTVAAFAVCLYEYAQTKGYSSIDTLKQSDEKPFILYGGDLSGVQKYIYSIKSKNAAKNLKGRSFMLHLITTTAVQKILDELNLFHGNIIYNSGGGFYLLLPNTEEVKQKLEKIETEIESELLEKFNGQLYLACGKFCFNTETVFNHSVGTLWKKLSEEINKSKRQRFNRSISTNYATFFEPSGNPGNIEKDSITGEELIQKDSKYQDMNRLTADQIRLGKKLKEAEYWYIVKGSWSEKEEQVTLLGYTHLLLKESNEKLDSKYVLKIRLNDSDDFLTESQALQMFEFYGGNDYPSEEYDLPKTFDKLTAGEYNKLGIVRMDVDNLGYVFKSGLSKQDRTFSRLSTLSRSLDLFFKGYINTLWNSNETYKKHIFILYAGGDDVFLLGDWKIAQEFTKQLRDDFRKYVCQNNYLTLSGGLHVVPPKYPILKAAEESEKVEKTAKDYEYKNEQLVFEYEDDKEMKRTIIQKRQKNAFAIFNTALCWDIEYTEVMKKAEELSHKIENGKLPKSLLQKIMTYYQRKNEKRTIWLMSYDFGRMAERYKDDKTYLTEILKDLLDNQWNRKEINDFAHSSFRLYALAARWAELLIRDKTNKNKLQTDKMLSYE